MIALKVCLILCSLAGMALFSGCAQTECDKALKDYCHYLGTDPAKEDEAQERVAKYCSASDQANLGTQCVE